MNTNTRATPEIVNACLALDVTYLLNGEPASEMLERLRERVIGEGMLAGETAAEVDAWSIHACLSPSAVVCEAHEAEIAAFIYPDQTGSSRAFTVSAPCFGARHFANAKVRAFERRGLLKVEIGGAGKSLCLLMLLPSTAMVSVQRPREPTHATIQPLPSPSGGLRPADRRRTDERLRDDNTSTQGRPDREAGDRAGKIETGIRTRRSLWPLHTGRTGAGIDTARPAAAGGRCRHTRHAQRDRRRCPASRPAALRLPTLLGGRHHRTQRIAAARIPLSAGADAAARCPADVGRSCVGSESR